MQFIINILILISPVVQSHSIAVGFENSRPLSPNRTGYSFLKRSIPLHTYGGFSNFLHTSSTKYLQ